MKQQIRETIWKLMEGAAVGTFSPSPFYGRVPFFRGDVFAFNRLTALEQFEHAQTVHVDQSSRTESLRKLILDSGKSLAFTQPQEDTFYRILHRNDIPFHYTTSDAVQRLGAHVMSKPIALEEPSRVDLMVVPSLVVDPETGERIGVGEGTVRMSADLEVGVLTEIGAVDAGTCLAAVVHADQLSDLSEVAMQSFDVPVDVVITPERTYYTQRTRQRPSGIHWDLLTEHHFHIIPCLRTLEALKKTKETRKAKGRRRRRVAVVN